VKRNPGTIDSEVMDSTEWQLSRVRSVSDMERFEEEKGFQDPDYVNNFIEKLSFNQRVPKKSRRNSKKPV